MSCWVLPVTRSTRYKDCEEGPFQRLIQNARHDRPVRPGSITIKATQQGTGRSFEKTYDVSEGETLEVDVRLQ